MLKNCSGSEVLIRLSKTQFSKKIDVRKNSSLRANTERGEVGLTILFQLMYDFGLGAAKATDDHHGSRPVG